MNNKILFIAPWPILGNSKDGMIQRVKAVDNCLCDVTRCYFEGSYSRFFRLEQQKDGGGRVTYYRGNVLKHFFLLWRLVRQSDIIYVHSIMSALNIILLLPFLSSKLVLDFHGVVPEERAYEGSRFMTRVFSIIEGYIIRVKNPKTICVTRSMDKFYQSKYPKANMNLLVFPIYPANILNITGDTKLGEWENEPEPITFIYSGNTQSWQNIPLMFSTIASIADNPGYRFIILTGEPEVMSKLLEGHQLAGKSNIAIDSVSPDELGKYYMQAHYGFILRDDVVVNRVANPTKLIEYLAWGITPIVKSSEIGDFPELGYEYIHYEALNKSMVAKKSVKNREIAIKISHMADPAAFVQYVLN